MGNKIKQFEIYWAELDPTIGAEIKKTRPCVVISPDAIQNNLKTVILAPLTHTFRNYPSRTQVFCGNQLAQVGLDQIRCLDKSRLHEKIGKCSSDEAAKISEILVEMFSLEA